MTARCYLYQWDMDGHGIQILVRCLHGETFVETITNVAINSGMNCPETTDWIASMMVQRCKKLHGGAVWPELDLNLYGQTMLNAAVTTGISMQEALDAINKMNVGLGWQPSTHPVAKEVEELIPALGKEVRNCPSCGPPVQFAIVVLVQHLNDKHKWTREKIADWLESLDIDLTIHPQKETVDAKQ